MISIHAVPPHQVRLAAQVTDHLIRKACDPFPDVDPEKLLSDAENNLAVFWLIADGVDPVGVCLTRLQKHADGLVLNVCAVGGENGREWLHQLRARLRDFAKAEGATKVTSRGSKAWGRIFKLTPEVRYYYEDRV